jgi:3-deoxy-D-manno-octulosonate 8-phosphate phosphatase (KDO 8-P phosphatase)
LTGENNQPAFYLAKRERFHKVYYKFANKQPAFAHFLETYKLRPQEVAFCFDDILDLSIAAQCGLRFLIRRNASPLFQKYVEENNLLDYQTANQGGKFAIREIAELILGITENYNNTIKKRQDFDKDYQKYLSERNKQETEFYIFKDNLVTATEI